MYRPETQLIFSNLCQVVETYFLENNICHCELPLQKLCTKIVISIWRVSDVKFMYILFQVLCSKCCHLRFRLEYLDAEARVCTRCHDILNKGSRSSSSSDISPEGGNSPSHKPNPNNPSDYCSTISPLQQATLGHHSPPAVMVPVGVLKRKGEYLKRLYS